MQLNRCLKCMQETSQDPCPYCGYSQAAAPRERNAMKPGTILNGRYLVGCMLGRGGFGMTYVAFDRMLQRKVAVKEYFPHGFVRRGTDGLSLSWATNDKALEMRRSGVELVLKEARKMAVVTNVPEIVRVLEVFMANDTAYIVMEYVAGVTLQTLLDKKGPLSWPKAERIFSPAIRAMSSIHSYGLIHRDLSPDNIMIMPDGGIRILDLGAAKDLNRNSGVSSVLVIKNGFSPMEQYLERGHSGPWTDVYSMAATIYYALTMNTPQDAMARMYDDQLDLSGPPFSEMPGHTVKALRHALEVRYANRTAGMKAFAEELFPQKPDSSLSAQTQKPAAAPQALVREQQEPAPVQRKPAREESRPVRQETNRKDTSIRRRRKKKRSRVVPVLVFLLILSLAAVGISLWMVFR